MGVRITYKDGLFNRVPWGDHEVPPSFTATWEFEADHTVEIDVHIEDRAPICDAIHIIRNPAKPSLNASELRRLPVEDFVTASCAEVAWHVDRTGDGTSSISILSPEQYNDAVRQGPKPRKRMVMNDDLLIDVARIWKANRTTGAPTHEVAVARNVSERTASRYVQEAKRRGFIEEGDG